MEVINFLTECLKISEIAYKQETERQNAVGAKLEYLFKWLTAFIAIGNIGVPLISKYANAGLFSWAFWILYSLISICLVAALILIIFVQFPRKQKYFPLGTDILKKVEDDKGSFAYKEDLCYQQILYWDNITNSLKQKNDKAVMIIKIISILFVLVIILLTVLFMYILTRTV